jgi:hypothetical protein
VEHWVHVLEGDIGTTASSFSLSLSLSLSLSFMAAMKEAAFLHYMFLP